MYKESFLMAWASLIANKMRSILTMLGIIIGVAAVITMVTLGRGLTASVQEDIAGLGSNVLIVFPLETDRGPVSMTLKAEEDIRKLASRQNLLIAATDGVQYRIPDTTRLDKQSRKFLERFL